MDVAAPARPLELLQTLAEPLDGLWITAALARRREALDQIQAEQRATEQWTASTALQLAHLWLVAGVPGRGDDLVLEAHQLEPQAGVIPDWWGLWPQANPAEPLQEMARSYVQLRHLPPLEAWRAWLEPVQTDRRRIDEPALRLLLGLVIQGRAQLPGALEPALEQLVDEELVAAEPALAWRFFEPLCERLPQWGYGRLKAADLSLQRGQLERCRQLLQGANDAQWQLAWLHDIAARLALAEGNVDRALEAWQRAIERCQASEANPEQQAQVLEIFRQRAREARRGPGVLQARSLLNRGQQAEAISLLELLLQQDPQWQPLRSLLEQARPGASTNTSSTASPTSAPQADLQRLDQRLQQLAVRAGLPWPPAELPPERDAAGAEQLLQHGLARLALLA
jgi:tetratricopeptide (TPR) repeat protein